ncbi:MAG TPA: hypothetical protein VD907_00970 [Verrucomicrobiae bacterium]|nr:hypothetical protein [Verrucomicrobiae bacterium]
MEKNTNNYLALGGGFILLVGLALLAMTNGWLGFDKQTFWPTYIVLGGIFMLILGFVIRQAMSRIVLTTLGTLATLTGVFFFLFSYNVYEWKAMEVLWPLFLAIPGASLLAGYYAGGEKKVKALLFIGIVLLVFGLIFLVLTTLNSSFAIAKLWPLFIIVVGLGMLIAGRSTRQ